MVILNNGSNYYLQEWDAVIEYLVALQDMEDIKKIIKQVS